MGPPAPTEHIEKMEMDVDEVGVDVSMSDQRDTTEVAIEGEGTPATSTLSLASTSERVGASFVPPKPTSNTMDLFTRFIIVPHKFLQSLVEWQNATTTHLTDIDFELAS